MLERLSREACELIKHGLPDDEVASRLSTKHRLEGYRNAADTS